MTGDKDAAALAHFWGQALTLRFLMSDQFSGCAAGKCVCFGVSQSASHDGLISLYNSRGFAVVLRKRRYPFIRQRRSWMPSEMPIARVGLLNSKLAHPPKRLPNYLGLWSWDPASTQQNGAALVYSSGNKIKGTEIIMPFQEEKFSSLRHLPPQHALQHYWIK